MTRIDVLAVLDAAIQEEELWGERDLAASLNLARAAIAELIEAADAVSEACVKHYGYGIDLHIALTGKGGKNERLVAALSRVRGAE